MGLFQLVLFILPLTLVLGCSGPLGTAAKHEAKKISRTQHQN